MAKNILQKCSSKKEATENLLLLDSFFLTNKVEERLREEQDRCQIYLDSSTLEALLKTCDEALITQHLELFHDKFEVDIYF